jgi:transcriptional regulator with XRE-family HTH domain
MRLVPEDASSGEDAVATSRRDEEVAVAEDAQGPLSGRLPTLGSYLRVRRDLCRPEDVGLVREPGRRVPGLRRDELATLAGISPDYYLKVEQGRVPPPSHQVLSAIARVLRLDVYGVEYMQRLAAGAHAGVDREPPTEAALQLVLDQWPRTPAYVSDRNQDVLAANRLVVALTEGGLAPGRNALEAAFSPQSRARMVDWEAVARAGVAALRLDGDAGSARYQELVAELSSDPDFARLWALHEVGRPSGFRVEARMEDGQQVVVHVQNLLVPESDGCRVTVYYAEPGSTAARLLEELAASVAG